MRPAKPGHGGFALLTAGLVLFIIAPAPAAAAAKAGEKTPAAKAPTNPAPRPARPAPPSRWDPDRGKDPYAGLDHTGTPSKPPRELSLPQESARKGKRRPRPNYDGRKSPPPTAGEVLVWIPRLIFLPVYVTFEYLIRWPIVSLITILEKYYVIPHIKSWFTTEDGRTVFFPTMYIDFGHFQSAGVYFSSTDLGFRTNKLTLQAGFGFEKHWYHVLAKDSFKMFDKDRGTFTMRAEFVWRPDQPFYGLGPRTEARNKAFYRLRLMEVELSLISILSGLNKFTIALFYRNLRVTGSERARSIHPNDRIDPDTGAIDPVFPWDGDFANQVPGVGPTFNLLRSHIKIELDTRRAERVLTPGSGVRLELFGSFTVDMTNTDLHYVRWGGEAAGFWDITGRNHVLALRVYTEVLEKTGNEVVPFHERLTLGGTEHLRGFITGRWRGDSALVFTLGYRYPIHYLLDANLFLSVGNVFNGRFDGFHFKWMAMAWGFGVRTNTSRDVSFDIMVAFGSNQFVFWDDNFKLDTVRFVVGVNQGF